MKKILIAIPLFCAALIGAYFLFPAQALEFFAHLERSASGLEVKTIEVDGEGRISDDSSLCC